MQLDGNVPPGPVAQKWTDYRAHCKLVNPANKRKFHVIVVGSGLAGGAAAASRDAVLAHQAQTRAQVRARFRAGAARARGARCAAQS